MDNDLLECAVNSIQNARKKFGMDEVSFQRFLESDLNRRNLRKGLDLPEFVFQAALNKIFQGEEEKAEEEAEKLIKNANAKTEQILDLAERSVKFVRGYNSAYFDDRGIVDALAIVNRNVVAGNLLLEKNNALLESLIKINQEVDSAIKS